MGTLAYGDILPPSGRYDDDVYTGEEASMNLLTDHVFSTSLGMMSLPGVLAALCRGDLVEFTEIGGHQGHPWHAFLVQIAALALYRDGCPPWPVQEGDWARLLASLAPPEAFCLVSDDLGKPAFFQPPVPKSTLKDHKHIETPDELDVIITSTNHDIKCRQMVAPSAEHWIYALLSLQTMQGYSGVGLYGVSRMNGGMGSRPCVSLSRDLMWATRFKRDVRLLLDLRAEILTRGFSDTGTSLLWLVPWDGLTSLPLATLDPFYLEICRRVRLIRQDGVIKARAAGSACARVESAPGGVTGDLWTPIRNARAFTAGPLGLTYRVIAQLLTEYETPALQLQPEDGASPVFLAEVLVRGQGQTFGFSRKEMTVPSEAIADRNALRDRIGGMISTVDTVKKMILFPAVSALVKATNHVAATRKWTDDFEKRVEFIFFDYLWGDLKGDWPERLVRISRKVLRKALDDTAIPTMRKYKVESMVEQIFWGCVKKPLGEVRM